MLTLTNDQKKIVNDLICLLLSLPEIIPTPIGNFFIIEDEPKIDELNTAKVNKAQHVIDHYLEQAKLNLELVNKMLERG